MFTINCKNIQLSFKGGFYEKERRITQMLSVDVSVSFDEAKYRENPILENTVDYAAIIALVRREVEGGVILLETLALTIADKIRAEYPYLSRIEILMRKRPHLSTNHDSVEVIYRG